VSEEGQVSRATVEDERAERRVLEEVCHKEGGGRRRWACLSRIPEGNKLKRQGTFIEEKYRTKKLLYHSNTLESRSYIPPASSRILTC
jgi:hypothetical protein